MKDLECAREGHGRWWHTIEVYFYVFGMFYLEKMSGVEEDGNEVPSSSILVNNASVLVLKKFFPDSISNLQDYRLFT